MFWKDENRIGDIVIPVLGPSGSGKSTFINTLVGKECMKVGYGLSSCTSKPTVAIIKSFPGHLHLKGRHLVVMDTPGFDDTDRSDWEILQSVAGSLKDVYQHKHILGGVIYLHDVTSDRMPEASRTQLRTLRALCGEEALSNVIFGTTNWGRDADQVGEKHEKELEARHWEPFIAKGSAMERFRDSQESAWTFINTLLLRLPAHGIVLDIHKELIDGKLSLEETAAGKEFVKRNMQVKCDRSLARRFRKIFGL